MIVYIVFVKAPEAERRPMAWARAWWTGFSGGLARPARASCALAKIADSWGPQGVVRELRHLVDYVGSIINSEF